MPASSLSDLNFGRQFRDLEFSVGFGRSEATGIQAGGIGVDGASGVL